MIRLESGKVYSLPIFPICHAPFSPYLTFIIIRKVYSWGDDSFGQLGISSAPRRTPITEWTPKQVRERGREGEREGEGERERERGKEREREIGS